MSGGTSGRVLAPRVTTAGAWLMAVALVLSACGSQDQSTAPSGSAASSATEAPSASPAGPKVATLGLGTPWQSLNPVIVQDGYSLAIISLMYDTLVWQSADQEFHPRLAESWEQSDDFQTFTFHLNQDAVWSDGTPVTADDVLATFAIGSHPDAGAAAASSMAIIEGTDESGISLTPGQAPSGATAPDAHTIVLKLKAPTDPNLVLYSIGANGYGFNILPASVLEGIDPADIATAPFGIQPEKTSGPFKFVQLQEGQFVELEANPDYFLGRPKLDKVFVRQVPQASLLVELRNGNIDVTAGPSVNSDMPLTDWQQLPDIEGLEQASVPGTAQDAPIINTTKPYLSDAKVRQALTMAIDRQLLVDQVLGGEGDIAVGPVNPLHQYFDDSVEPWPFDPDAARSMLEEANFPFDQKLTFAFFGGRATISQSAQLIQQQWASIGVQAELVSVDFGGLVERFDSGEWDLAMYPTTFSSGGVADPGASADWFRCGGSANYGGFCSDTVDQAYDDGAATAIADERADAYSRLQEAIHEQSPVIFLYFRRNITGYSSRVNDWMVPTVLGLTAPWMWDVDE